jgi:hypothetical protein
MRDERYVFSVRKSEVPFRDEPFLAVQHKRSNVSRNILRSKVPTKILRILCSQMPQVPFGRGPLMVRLFLRTTNQIVIMATIEKRY